MTDSGMQPLASRCSLCGEGFHPNVEIDISDEPMVSSITEETEYRWSHVQCHRDHGRIFMEAFDL